MLITIIIFVAVLAIMVLAHEFGHFIVAMKNGIKVDEFGFGFPPRIFGIQLLSGERLDPLIKTEEVDIEISEERTQVVDKIKEVDVLVPLRRWRCVWGSGDNLTSSSGLREGTIYSINWIPLGGFVKIKGENGECASESDSFGNKSIWRRTFVLAAGVIMNFVLAGFLLTVGFMIGLPQSLDDLGYGARIKDAKIEIMSVLEKTPAALAGIEPGDQILQVDALSGLKVQDLQNYIDAKKGQKVKFVFKRGSEDIIKEITPVELVETKKGGIGVSLLESGLVSYPWYLSLYHGFESAIIFCWEIIKAFGLLLVGIFRGSPVAENLSGPVGIAVLTGRVARLGFVYLLQFTAILSLNLAILNALPFPALDGGRILFLLIEKLRGRPFKQKVENVIHTAGFALLMLLVIFVTYKDVMRFSSSFVRLGKKLIGG